MWRVARWKAQKGRAGGEAGPSGSGPFSGTLGRQPQCAPKSDQHRSASQTSRTRDLRRTRGPLVPDFLELLLVGWLVGEGVNVLLEEKEKKEKKSRKLARVPLSWMCFEM